MIFHPPILALLAASLISSVVLAGSSLFALRLLYRWDLDSGSEVQIGLERTTHLVSTVVAFVLVLEAASLVLFTANADRMAPLFVGAMCAVGTLSANVYGFPTLWAKIAVFFAAFVWLAFDRVDGRTRDHALIRVKYAGLLVLAPLVFTETTLELAYFLDLKADTITSCCGKLFNEEKPDLGGELAAFDPVSALVALAACLATAIGFGVAAPRGRTPAALHGLASLVAFAAALAAVVAAVAPYVYEQPHHHCPFCILKGEYGHIGFALYVPLFVATGAGLASGLLALFSGHVDEEVAATSRRGLARTALAGHAIFALVTAALVLRSGLSLHS